MNSYSTEIKPIKDELVELGIEVTEIADLKYKSREEYRKALPILLEWLPKIQDELVKEDIVRTLSMPWAKPESSHYLIREFKNRPKKNLAWAIGNGISITAVDSDLNDLVSIVEDKSYGRNREMVVVALGNVKNERSEDTLINLLHDEEVSGHAIIALRKLKSEKALNNIKAFTDHPKSWIRNEAKKAIKIIESSRE